ncbi:flagellar protein FlaG [Clostridium sp.]|uniref:flagellar protein FlaG n=1 Tax=Clostridium sp. TaxID=1506 RepID=UPI003D6CF3C8
MEIRGVSGNNSMDFGKTHMASEKVDVSKFTESNNSLSEKDKGEKQIKSAVSKINKLLEGEGTHLQYEKHDVLNQMIVRVIDNNTNEVINEIPNKKILDMVVKMCEMAGVLVDKKA